MSIVIPQGISSISKGPMGSGDFFDWTNSSSPTWTTANCAYLVPFNVLKAATAKRMWVVNGPGPTGSLDLGIYDSAFTRLVAKGATAQAGSNVVQFLDITDTPLSVGRYHMAISCNSGAARFYACSDNGIRFLVEGMGGVYSLSAYPLPATITPAVIPDDYLPLFGIEFGSLT